MTDDNKDGTTGNGVEVSVSPSDIVTVAQAAARLGRSVRTVKRWIASGKLATVDVGGRRYVQLAGLSPGGTNAYDTRGHMTHAEPDAVQVLKDTIRRQDAVIAHLQGEVTGLRETVDRVTRMLPGAQIVPPAGQSRGARWLWALLILAIGAGLGVVGGLLWLRW